MLTCHSAAWRWKTLGVPVVIGGDNLPSPIWIGLTDLPGGKNAGEIGGRGGPLAPSNSVITVVWKNLPFYTLTYYLPVVFRTNTSWRTVVFIFFHCYNIPESTKFSNHCFSQVFCMIYTVCIIILKILGLRFLDYFLHDKRFSCFIGIWFRPTIFVYKVSKLQAAPL